ncbi:MAG: CPBP family intramembrane metalloprotease [Clostridia bacterium]|nr:CPBP family intramembrane metalloprotease [Clostridia bacterium]
MKIKSIHGAPLLLTVITILLIVAGQSNVSFLSQDDNAYLIAALLGVLIFAIPSAIYARARGRGFISHMRLKLFKAIDIPMMIFALGFMIFGAAMYAFYVYRFAPELFDRTSSAAFSSSDRSAVNGIYAVLSVAILPAITEEFLYRGIVVTEYERSGVVLSAILSSFSFALIHFDIVKLPVYFFNGIILTVVLYATRSLIAAMVIHAANNIVVMFFEVYVYRAAVRQGGGVLLFTFICTAVTLVFAFLFFNSVSKAYEDLSQLNAKPQHPVSRSDKRASTVTSALTSPFFIALIIVSAVGILLNL